jgi:hypothetical protein
MYNRQRLRRERLEVYLVHLILAYRPMILLCGLLLLAYAGFLIFKSLLAGSLILLAAVLLLLLGSSYYVVVHTARLLAWTVTLWRHND